MHAAGLARLYCHVLEVFVGLFLFQQFIWRCSLLCVFNRHQTETRAANQHLYEPCYSHSFKDVKMKGHNGYFVEWYMITFGNSSSSCSISC